MTRDEEALFNGLRVFGIMYDGIEPRLKEAAIRMLRDASEVAEFMLDCRAVLLSEAINSFNPYLQGFADWAERTVVNLCRKRREQLDAEIPLDEIENEPDPHDLIADVEARVDYEMAVARLPPMQRKCWQLHQDGYSYSEISRMLGSTTASVGMNLTRARKLVRSEML